MMLLSNGLIAQLILYGSAGLLHVENGHNFTQISIDTC